MGRGPATMGETSLSESQQGIPYPDPSETRGGHFLRRGVLGDIPLTKFFPILKQTLTL